MKFGILESLFFLPRLALIAIVILLVVIVIQNAKKNKADKPKQEPPRVGYGMNDKSAKSETEQKEK